MSIDDVLARLDPYQVQRIRMPKLNRNAVPLTPAQQYQCARLGTMRYWTRFESAAA